LPDYRMPGYGAIYYLFRLIFSQVFAYNALIIFQFILAGISVYYLALTARFIFESDVLFYVCFYLFLISTYSNYFDGWLLTESLAGSLLIFSVWFFTKYFETGKPVNLLFAGIIIGWTIFIRPVFMPVVFFLAIILVFARKEQFVAPKTSMLKGLLLLIPPFLIAEGIWIIKNYEKHQKLIVVTSVSLAPNAKNFYEPSLFHFLHSWGGSADFGDNSAPLFWFGFHNKGTPIPKDYQYKFPEYMYTSKFNMDSLVWLKNKITALNDSSLSPEKRYVYQVMVRDKLEKYLQSEKDEHPFLYYVRSPIFHCLPRFLFASQLNIYVKRFQAPGKLGLFTQYFFTFFYYLMLALGFAGILILFYKGLRKNRLSLIIAIIPTYTVVIHALIIRVTSNRFLMPAWAFLVMSAAYALVVVFSKEKSPGNSAGA